MATRINVAILDNHQSIIDGYRFRLQGHPRLQIVATAHVGAELEPLLATHVVDVLLLDASVPLVVGSSEGLPILSVVPQLLQRYPQLHILMASLYSQRAFIQAVMEAGASGYLLKDDWGAIERLAEIIETVAAGAIYLSQQAMHEWRRATTVADPLSVREREVLALCGAYPNASTAELAARMSVAHSTVRNLLSHAYLKLGVHNRSAAIAKAQHLGLLPPLESASLTMQVK